MMCWPTSLPVDKNPLGTRPLHRDTWRMQRSLPLISLGGWSGQSPQLRQSYKHRKRPQWRNRLAVLCSCLRRLRTVQGVLVRGHGRPGLCGRSTSKYLGTAGPRRRREERKAERKKTALYSAVAKREPAARVKGGRPNGLVLGRNARRDLVG